VLSDSQEEAITTVLRAREQGRGLVIIDGQAGTGKTTTISELKRRLGTDAVVYAPTNAAARRLQSKGIDEAMTFYRGEFVSRSEYTKRFRELDDELQEALAERPQNVDKIATVRAKRDSLKEKRKLGFTHISEFEGDDLRGALQDKRDRFIRPVAVMDESSMVTTGYFEEMRRDGRLIVMVGDEFQLPPVKGRNIYSDYEPTVTLTHVHRHDGPILQLAQEIRTSDEFDLKPFRRKSVDGERLGMLIATGDAMIVAWRNDTVDEWNDRIRSKLGYVGEDPQVGERLISRSNAGDLLNNEIVTVVATEPSLLVRNEFGQMVEVEDFQMVTSKVPRDTDGQNLFSFGYCITAHRAQGNEWKHVVVVDQRAGMKRVMPEREVRQWLYTAVTRSQNTLVVL
jgi:exodeoxyribonuclease-5